MAQVIPYTDPNARGQLNQSICFRRKFGKVFLGNTSRPANPRTEGQTIQRTLFASASKQFPYLNYETRQFYIKRAAMLSTDAKSLFMKNSLNNILPVNTPGIPIKSIDELVVLKQAGTVPNNFVIEVESVYIDLQSIGCYFWNKQGSDKQIERSEIGPAGILSDPVTYAPGRFDDGISDVYQDNHILFPDAFSSPNIGIADFWWEPHFPSTWGDAWANLFTANIGALRFSLLWAPSSYSYAPRQFVAYVNDSGPPRLRVHYSFIPPVFAAGSEHYIALLFDLSAGAGQKIKLFLDNDFLPLEDALYDQAQDLPTLPLNLFWGYGSSNSTLDNLKLYTDPSFFNIITGNKNNENFYLNPLPGITYASIQDTSKIFTEGETETVTRVQRIKIMETAGVGAKIPFYYTVLVNWQDFEDNVSHGIMRLPEINLVAGEVKYLYIASDWSLYWDTRFTRLAGAY